MVEHGGLANGLRLFGPLIILANTLNLTHIIIGKVRGINVGIMRLSGIIFKYLGFLATYFAFSFSTAAQEYSVIMGTWLTQSQSEITIEPCEQGFCGHISKIVIPQHIIDKYGSDVLAAQGNFTDELNKDPALRSRLIQGLQILVLDGQSAPDRYEGEIYNPENGETFNGFVEIQSSDNIRLSGCVLFNLICMGEDWTRVIL